MGWHERPGTIAQVEGNDTESAGGGGPGAGAAGCAVPMVNRVVGMRPTVATAARRSVGALGVAAQRLDRRR